MTDVWSIGIRLRHGICGCRHQFCSSVHVFVSSSRLDHLDDTTASGVRISPVGPLLKTLTPLDRIPSLCSNPFSLLFCFSICLFRYLRLHCHVVCPLSHSLLTQVYLFLFFFLSNLLITSLSLPVHFFPFILCLCCIAHFCRHYHHPPPTTTTTNTAVVTLRPIHPTIRAQQSPISISYISPIPIPPNNPNSTNCLLCIVYHTYFPSPLCLVYFQDHNQVLSCPTKLGSLAARLYKYTPRHPITSLYRTRIIFFCVSCFFGFRIECVFGLRWSDWRLVRYVLSLCLRRS